MLDGLRAKVLIASALLAGACGDDGEGSAGASTAGGGGGATSSVATGGAGGAGGAELPCSYDVREEGVDCEGACDQSANNFCTTLCGDPGRGACPEGMVCATYCRFTCTTLADCPQGFDECGTTSNGVGICESNL